MNIRISAITTAAFAFGATRPPRNLLAGAPLTVLIPQFVTRNSVDYGLMNAAGIVAILPPVLLVIFLNCFLVQGLMAGASK